MPASKKTKAKNSGPKKKASVTPKTSQLNKNLKFMLVGFVLLLAVGLLFTTQLLQQQKNEINDFVKINELLLEDKDRIKGYACGILSEYDAKSFLNVEELELNSINISLPYRLSDPDQPSVRHADGCYYESANNSNEYAQVIFFTYPDNAAAKDRFMQHLPPLAEPVEKDNFLVSTDGIVYDAGVHYILKGRQVIEIAASNGIPSEIEQFSETLVKILEPRL
jgi:cell division protein FtsL